MKTKTTTPPLRAAQLRILPALAGADKPLSRAEMAAAAPCDQAGLTEWIGSSDPATRKANDAKHFPSLLTLGFVSQEPDVTPAAYRITAAGRKLLTKPEAEPAPAAKPLTLADGTKVRHTVTDRKGVVHAQSTEEGYVLVRYGRETRPTLSRLADLAPIKQRGAKEAAK